MHKATHCTSNLTFFAILLHPYPCWGRALDITPKICCRHCCKTLPHLTINTTSSKKLTPQADQESGQYRSGHDWYSKLISLEHEHRLLKFWTEFCALHYGDLLASKKQKIRIDCSQKETRPWRHDAMQQTTELNIIAIDDHQKMEPPRSLSRSRNSHVNRRKKEEKLKFPTTAIMKKLG